MRTIKFKCYILDNDKKVEREFYEWLDGDGWKHDFYSPLVSNGVFSHEELGDGFFGDIIRVQFTGLLDKNGKEIYEGYILRNPPKDDWDKINYSCFEVFFHDGDANSDYNIGYSMNRMYNHGSVCGGYIPAFKPKYVSKMEIIGNIHDNPELLNKNSI